LYYKIKLKIGLFINVKQEKKDILFIFEE